MPILVRIFPFLIISSILTSCSDVSPKVYSLAEIGQLKKVFRYTTSTMDSSTAIPITDLGVNIYVTSFTVTTLNNGAAFVTLNLFSDSNNSFNLVEYLPVESKLTDTLFVGQGAHVSCTFDLTGALPSVSIQPYKFSGEADGSPKTIEAPLSQ